MLALASDSATKLWQGQATEHGNGSNGSLSEAHLAQHLVKVIVSGLEAACAHALLTLGNPTFHPPPRSSVASCVCPTELAQVQAGHIMTQPRKQSGPGPGHSHGSVLA